MRFCMQIIISRVMKQMKMFDSEQSTETNLYILNTVYKIDYMDKCVQMLSELTRTCFSPLISPRLFFIPPPSFFLSHFKIIDFPPSQSSPPVPLWPPPPHCPPTAPPLLASSPSPRPTWCRRPLSRSPPSLQWSGPPPPLRPPVPAPTETGSKVIYRDSSQSVRGRSEGRLPSREASFS